MCKLVAFELQLFFEKFTLKKKNTELNLKKEEK